MHKTYGAYTADSIPAFLLARKADTERMYVHATLNAYNLSTVSVSLTLSDGVQENISRLRT